MASRAGLGDEPRVHLTRHRPIATSESHPKMKLYPLGNCDLNFTTEREMKLEVLFVVHPNFLSQTQILTAFPPYLKLLTRFSHPFVLCRKEKYDKYYLATTLSNAHLWVLLHPNKLNVYSSPTN